MPELPDITVYIEALEKRIVGQKLVRVRLGNPFILRTAVPPIGDAEGRIVKRVFRIGKRIAIGLEGDLTLVIHLMIAGRLQWRDSESKPYGRNSLAVFEFSNGWLTLTEAGTKRRASLHLLQGQEAVDALNPGGIEPLSGSFEEFAEAIRSENHTIKRTLTDPRIFSGIGNSYSDEILFEARMSPFAMTSKLTDVEIERLRLAVINSMTVWTDRLRAEAGDEFPENVTAFRKEMAVHGKYEQPCPQCGTAVQRIRYADNETNYCATCQTGGKLLSDRALSRLLGSDWPKTVEALELATRKRRGE